MIFIHFNSNTQKTLLMNVLISVNSYFEFQKYLPIMLITYLKKFIHILNYKMTYEFYK